ncbi:hypothetical protein [Streptomyces sp. YIM S03343]
MHDDELGMWGVRLAGWAAPDETALAARTTHAYAAGGKARRDLFRTGGLAPGGFGGGITVLLPALLDALAYAADAVKAVLGSQEFANGVAAVALVAGLRAQRTEQEPPTRPTGTSADGRTRGDGNAAGTPRARGTGSPNGEDGENATGRAPGGQQPSAEVMLAAFGMCRRLRARGVEADTAEELVAALTARLLSAPDPDGIAGFLDALVANEPPAPAVPQSRRPRTPLRRLAGAASGLLHRRTARRTGTAPGRPTAQGETDDA